MGVNCGPGELLGGPHQDPKTDLSKDSGPSIHNARISDDHSDSEGLDPVTILHDGDTGLVVGAPGPAKLSQLDGARDSPSSIDGSTDSEGPDPMTILYDVDMEVFTLTNLHNWMGL